MHRIASYALGSLTALAVLVGSASLVASADATSAPSAAKAAKKTPTHFAFSARAYGSKLTGGQVPTSSGATAYQSIGCTNLAGIRKNNRAATSDLAGLGTAKGVATRNWTTQQGGVVASHSSNKTAKVTTAQAGLGELTIKRITSLSTVSHDATGFHTSTKTSVGDITFRSTDGKPQDIDPPTASQDVEIPGVLKISYGGRTSNISGDGAKATADGLTVLLIPSGTKLRLAHTAAGLTSGVKHGLFQGMAASTETRSDDALLRSGPQPLLKMPCLGTKGETRTKSTSTTQPDPAIGAYEAHTREVGSQSGDSATGFTEATISTATIGGGALQLSGIVGRVNVTRTDAGLTKDVDGTTIGSAVLNGQSIALPALDGLEIPGVVRVDTNIVTEVKNGLDVVSVRLTFLDGSGRVTDLGHARLAIGPAS
jgi:hypothetical protein